MTPIEALEQLLASGEIRPDPAQRAAVERLDKLAREIDGYQPKPKRKSGGFLSRIGLGGGGGPQEMEPPPKGLYIFGPVGRGKSMLMDLFFDQANVSRKRRVHFHAFMQDVQKLAHSRRQANRDGDPIPEIAADVASTAWLLCFDEFQVDNIVDAMILGRLFEKLFQAGVVVVATSNAPPRDLYKDGLQRDRFLPFLDVMASHVETYELDGGEDYRLERLKGRPVYHTPHSAEAQAALVQAFADLTDEADGEPMELEVQGRKLIVPKTARSVAFYTFDQLCRQPLGPGDYLALAREFDTFILSHIPVMRPEDRNEAKCLDSQM